MPIAAPSKRGQKDNKSNATKKRRVDGDNRSKKLSLTVAPSSFEQELGNLTQEIQGLKDGNAETDQKWGRPSLDPSWSPQTDNLLFQQIDIEEGHLNCSTAIRLFGVTEVIRCFSPFP
jgi:DNA polymerase delta subunit 1